MLLLQKMTLLVFVLLFEVQAIDTTPSPTVKLITPRPTPFMTPNPTPQLRAPRPTPNLRAPSDQKASLTPPPTIVIRFSTPKPTAPPTFNIPTGIPTPLLATPKPTDIPTDPPTESPTSSQTPVSTSGQWTEVGCTANGCAVTLTLTEESIVEVIPTDYDSNQEFLDLRLGASSYRCNPNAQSAHNQWYRCGTYGPGALVVDASPAVNCCAYNGYIVYVRYKTACMEPAHAACLECESADSCLTLQCDDMFFDMDGEMSNGCEATCANPDNASCLACRSPNTCDELECDPFFLNTDGDISNGCEAADNSPRWTEVGCSYPGCDIEVDLSEESEIEIMATDFDTEGEYADIFRSNSFVDYVKCNPNLQCSTTWSGCGSFGPGRFTVASTDGVNICPYNGDYLYVRYRPVGQSGDGPADPTNPPRDRRPGRRIETYAEDGSLEPPKQHDLQLL